MPIDLRKAINAISDVVYNRPKALREFDQIYMKVGDMVVQAEFIARKYADKDLVFIGDGDAISLSIAHMKNQEILEQYPKSIHLLDFDERMLNAVKRFAENHELDSYITTELYNVADPLTASLLNSKDAFYTNPPWGASNGGQSVDIFVERGMETLRKGGEGVIVIADDPELKWTHEVLYNVQKGFLSSGFIVREMIPALHSYHLDDAPNLKSCAMLIKHVYGDNTTASSQKVPKERLLNFYGRDNPLTIKYVRDTNKSNVGKAPDGSYTLERLE